MTSPILLVGTDEEVEDVFRQRLLYGKSPSQIARKLKISRERARDLRIAATYWGSGFRDGCKYND